MHNIFSINGKNVLFIHIPKTAGTSVMSCLFNSSKIIHYPLRNYPENLLKDVFVFCIIRNPFDRFISQWLYHTNFKNNFFYENYGNKKIDVFSYLKLVKNNLHRTTWKSMTSFTFHKNKKVDFFLRFENLSRDWVDLCKILGVDVELKFFKKNIEKKHYSFYYNDLLVHEIENVYKYDIINFNYKFEKP